MLVGGLLIESAAYHAFDPAFASRAEGKVEGSAEGKAEAILAVLAARKIELTNRERARMAGTTSPIALDRMLVVAATCPRGDEVFD
jgi:hypothetical protein